MKSQVRSFPLIPMVIVNDRQSLMCYSCYIVTVALSYVIIGLIITFPLIRLRQPLNLTSIQYAQQQSATQGSNDTAHTLSRRTASTIRFNTEGVGCQKRTATSFANNPTRPGLYLASIYQMAPPKRGSTHPIIALLLIYRTRKDKGLSWPSWLTCSGRFTYINDHPSVAGQAQEFRTGKVYRRSSTVLRNQQCFGYGVVKVAYSTYAKSCSQKCVLVCRLSRLSKLVCYPFKQYFCPYTMD